MDEAAAGRSTFGEQLRHDRLVAGLTQEELAERSGLSVRAIGDLERGRVGRPRMSTLRQLAEALSRPAERPAPSGRPPRELPVPAALFAGRADELATLTALYDQSQKPVTTVISAIGGAAGVGKTALALRWAHDQATAFPDGQLYVDLRGYDPGPPLSAQDALAGFLRAFGVSGQDVPQDPAERAARYRSLLAGRRVLVLLDNARDAEQVRPLLPGAAGCMALVTSRDALAGLVARDGARRLELELLPSRDAVSLLHALIGERAESDPLAVEALARQCAGLPLALRVAAELVSARPGVPLRALVDELADQHRLLDLLDAGGDPRTEIRAVFSWSCQYLDSVCARAFRLLGLHPGTQLEPSGLAALTGGRIEQASRILTVLSRAHLIQPVSQDSYTMHDLLRAYAAEQAAAHETGPDRHEALTRLFDYYLGTASIAMDLLFPADEARSASAPKPVTPSPVTEPDAARSWLNANLATLVRVIGYTADRGWTSHAVRLADAIFRYLDAGSRVSEIIAVYGHAERAAGNAGDKRAQAQALNNLSLAYLRQGDFGQGRKLLERSLGLYEESADITGQAYALGNLGIIEYIEGSYRSASACHHRALAFYRQAEAHLGEARTLANLALVELRLESFDQAAGHFQRSFELGNAIGALVVQAQALSGLGRVSLGQHNFQAADRRLEAALAMFREMGDQAGEADVLSVLGAMRCAQRRPARALLLQREALALYRKVGDPAGQAQALNGMAEALLASGDGPQAQARAAMALALAERVGDKYEQTRSRRYLAAASATAASRPGQGSRSSDAVPETSVSAHGTENTGV